MVDSHSMFQVSALTVTWLLSLEEMASEVSPRTRESYSPNSSHLRNLPDTLRLTGLKQTSTVLLSLSQMHRNLETMCALRLLLRSAMDSLIFVPCRRHQCSEPLD